MSHLTTHKHCQSSYLRALRHPSTTVEIALQISPFYAKQTQSQVRQNQRKHLCNNEIRKNGHLVIQTNKPNQTQFKPKQTRNKPNSLSS